MKFIEPSLTGLTVQAIAAGRIQGGFSDPSHRRASSRDRIPDSEPVNRSIVSVNITALEIAVPPTAQQLADHRQGVLIYGCH